LQAPQVMQDPTMGGDPPAFNWAISCRARSGS